MKTTLYILMAIIIFTGANNAQTIDQDNPRPVPQICIDNLLQGLKSSNNGLRRSCIFLLGQYKIKEGVPALAKLLDKETSAKNRKLIAVSLYNIGEEKGIKKVKEHASFDANAEVRRMCNAIVYEFAKNSKNENQMVSITEN